MIDIDALKNSGLTNKSLRAIFESKAPETTPRKKVPTQKSPGKGAQLVDEPGAIGLVTKMEKLPENPTKWDVKCLLTTMIQSEINEGMVLCASKMDAFAAMDLAYASQPIHPLTNDLMRVAMGHITPEQCQSVSGELTDELRSKVFEKDAKGAVARINAPELLRVSHNLVHSLVSRRTAALATAVYQQYPVISYSPYSNSPTERLRGDVTTQLSEQMAGSYGYRHDYEESIRQASLYTTSYKFKAKHYHTEKQTLPKPVAKNGATSTGKAPKKEFERRIVREGVEFVIPHPSRVSHDTAKPLSKLNNDLGPNWINHWEAVRIGSVRNDPAYFNTEAIGFDTGMVDFFTQNSAYFSQYYPQQIKLPGAPAGKTGPEIVVTNDRVANIGTWAELDDDTSTILCQHYKRIIPKNVGLGTYEDPVWIRFVTVANTTVVYAEIVGSSPASVNSYNATDGLLMSPSFGMQALQWQQMLTNQMNQLIHAQYEGMVKIYSLNTDGMKKQDVDSIVNQLKNPDFTHIASRVITYSQEKMSQIAQGHAKGQDRLSRVVVDTGEKIREIFNNIVQTLALAERLMFFSPQELGQVSPRSVTATEMKSISDTTLGIRDYHMIGIKQQMEADKRIVLESYMAFGSEDLEVPVAERYDPKVIEQAGFTIVDDGTGRPPDGLYTIRGKKLGLLYNYTYTTRNTDDTPPDAARAQGIAQVMEIISRDPVLTENLPLEQRLELANSIFAILSPTIFKLRVPEGVDPKKTAGGQVEQMQQQLQQALPQIGKMLQEMAGKLEQQEVKISQQDAGMKALADALNRISGVLQKGPKQPALGPSTQRGTVSPTIPNGAPPLRNVARPTPPPAL